MKNLVVLISGQGRNLQALMRHCAAGNIPARIVAVISNTVDAPGLLRAKQAGIPIEVVPHIDYPSREAFDAALAALIDGYQPDVLALAGFMRILTPGFTRRYQGRALNIHPSLLPRHPGLKTHAAALAAGDTEHGASVHFVTEALDGGPVALQGQFTITADDNPITLSERVMNEVELKIFPQAIAWRLRGTLQLIDGRVCYGDAALSQPLGLQDLEEVFR